MLLSFLLFTKLFYPNQLKVVYDNKNIKNREDYKNSVLLNIV